jgi:hypothetical protein
MTNPVPLYNPKVDSNEWMFPSISDPSKTFIIPSTTEDHITSVFPFSFLNRNTTQGVKVMEMVSPSPVSSTQTTFSNVTNNDNMDMDTQSRKNKYSSEEDYDPSYPQQRKDKYSSEEDCNPSYPQPRKMKKLSPQPPPRKLSAQLEESMLPRGHHKNEGDDYVEGWHYRNVPAMHLAGFLLQDNVAYGYPGV